MKHEAASGVVQAAPSAAAVGIWLTGIELQWWAALLGVIFLLMQIAHFAWKWYREWRDVHAQSEK